MDRQKNKISHMEAAHGGYAPQIFEIGPLGRWLPGTRALARSKGFDWRAAALVALLAWLPLPLLALISDGGYGRVTASMLSDWGVHFRLLLSVPALLFADAFCGARLSAIAAHFHIPEIVGEENRPALEALLARTKRACESAWVAAVIVIAAYIITVVLFTRLPLAEFPLWQRGSAVRATTPSGWWHVIVSAPLLLALVMGWLWRWLVWFWLLIRLARMPFELCAAHPDHAAGLKFVGFSVRAFVPIGFAVGAMLAGRVAAEVMRTGAKLETFQYVLAEVVIAVIAMAVIPTVAFSLRLMAEWRAGVFTYGRLSSGLGQRFEEKWIRAGRKLGPDMLEQTDFSAAIDLSSYVANVYDMQLLPIDIRSIVILAIFTAAPMLPVVLVGAPLSVILDDLAGVFF